MGPDQRAELHTERPPCWEPTPVELGLLNVLGAGEQFNCL